MHIHPGLFCDYVYMNISAFMCVCVKEREITREREKGHVFHTEIRAFLSSSIIVQFFCERCFSILLPAKRTAIPECTDTHTYTGREIHRSLCVSWQNLTLSWWRGG